MPKRDELETTSATFSFAPYKLLHTKCFVQVQIPVWFFLELFIAPLNKRNEIFILTTATFTMPLRLEAILPTVAFHMTLSMEAAILILDAVILGWKADELWQNSKSNAHSCDLFCTTEKIILRYVRKRLEMDGHYWWWRRPLGRLVTPWSSLENPTKLSLPSECLTQSWNTAAGTDGAKPISCMVFQNFYPCQWGWAFVSQLKFTNNYVIGQFIPIENKHQYLSVVMKKRTQNLTQKNSLFEPRDIHSNTVSIKKVEIVPGPALLLK